MTDAQHTRPEDGPAEHRGHGPAEHRGHGPAEHRGGARSGWGEEGYAAWMRLALAEARAVAGTGDVPIGAVVVGADGSVLGRGRNLREAEHDPTAHAEVVALREAGSALGSWRLDGCSLVVTLEPCAMCAGAAVLARVDRVVLGAWDPKAGACGSVWDLPRDRRALHRPEVVGGILQAECGELLLDFFGERRGVGGHDPHA